MHQRRSIAREAPRAQSPAACGTQVIVCCVAALLLRPALAAPNPRWSKGLHKKAPPPGGVQETLALHDHARRYVAGHFKYSNDLLCTGSRIHGLVTKRALQRRQPDKGETWQYARRNISISTNRAMVMIFPKDKIVFVRHFKASSTTVSYLLIDLLCNDPMAQPGDGCFLVGRDALEPRDAWADHFVLTWVRNPLARMASSFTYFNASMRVKLGRNKPGDACLAQSFGEYSVRSLGQGDACERRRCCSYLRPALGNNNTWFRPTWFLKQHTVEMSHFVYDNAGRSSVNFVGRTENLWEDWHQLRHVLSTWTGRQLVNRAMQSINQQEPDVRLECDGLRYAGLYDAASMRSMAMQYAIDMWRFGYLEAPPRPPGRAA